MLPVCACVHESVCVCTSVCASNGRENCAHPNWWKWSSFFVVLVPFVVLAIIPKRISSFNGWWWPRERQPRTFFSCVFVVCTQQQQTDNNNNNRHINSETSTALCFHRVFFFLFLLFYVISNVFAYDAYWNGFRINRDLADWASTINYGTYHDDDDGDMMRWCCWYILATNRILQKWIRRFFMDGFKFIDWWCPLDANLFRHIARID